MTTYEKFAAAQERTNRAETYEEFAAAQADMNKASYTPPQPASDGAAGNRDADDRDA